MKVQGMLRAGMPALSAAGEAAVATYVAALRDWHDLCPTTCRNYASDVRQVASHQAATWRDEGAAGRLLCELVRRRQCRGGGRGEFDDDIRTLAG